ncbi:hypothetical protein [Prauserella marina]|nr:hypothetical protein [Prauserella marina]
MTIRAALRRTTAVSALGLLLAACGGSPGTGGGTGAEGSGEGGDRAQVIGSWQDEFCPTVQPELAAERMSSSEFGFGPTYMPMGNARTPNTFDCEAEPIIKVPDARNDYKGYVAIAVYNGKEPARSGVEAYYRERLAKWTEYYEELEPGPQRTNREENDALTPFLDEAIEGPWEEGHAYAINAAGVYDGSAFAAIRTKDYALFVTVDYPMDREVRMARDASQSRERNGSTGFSEEEIESRRELPFTDEEIAEWTTGEYITTVYEAIEAKLES